VAGDILGLVELSEDGLGQNLAEFDTHLIEGVYSPNNTLDENFVLVKRDQGAESCGRQQWEDDAVAWSVSLEDFALDQRFASIWSQLLPDLLLGLSKGQSLGLSEEI